MRAGGRGVLGVYYFLDNILHYYYCQSEGGEDSSQGGECSQGFYSQIKVIHLKVNEKRN